MSRPAYDLVLAPGVLEALEAVPDPRLRRDIAARIDGLKRDPADKGRPLTGELSGFYVLRSSEAGYRVIYRIEGDRVVIYAVTVEPGRTMRSVTAPDLHTLARRLVAMKMFEPEFLEAGRERDSMIGLRKGPGAFDEKVTASWAAPGKGSYRGGGVGKRSARGRKSKSGEKTPRGSRSKRKKPGRPRGRRRRGGQPDETDHE